MKPDHPPCHIIANVGDKKTLCGLKVNDPDVGHCWAPFVQVHKDGHDAKFCLACEAKMGQPPPPPPLPGPEPALAATPKAGKPDALTFFDEFFEMKP